MLVQLIRHARTPGNEQKRYVGRTDEPLSEGGRAELLEWAGAAAYRPAQLVFTSPLRRCVETAALIFPEAAPMTVAQLAECDFGKFEGKTYDELKDDADYRRWLDAEGRAPIPGGEAPSAFRLRSCEGFARAMDAAFESGCAGAAFVVHGGSIMAILERFAPGGGFYRWQAGNCAGFRFEALEVVWRASGQVGEPEKILRPAVDKSRRTPL